MRNDRRCFLQWFVLLLAYISAAMIAAGYGLLQTIFATDVTYMTSAIAVIFSITALYLGYASWNFRSHDPQSAEADIGLANKAAYIVTLFGLLGTVIGLQHQVQAMASVSPDNLMPFLSAVSTALGTAFYATGCGIVASIAIIAMAANLEYFVDSAD